VIEEKTVVELRMDPLARLRNQAETADVDLLRGMVRVFLETIISADADALCGALHGERTDDRLNRRNGYRDRDSDTRAGTIELRVPKLRLTWNR
jgi:putative transposase